ncbi:MAG: hypothetical protein AUJ54_05170 [Ignavibacteria bacterium CG1_02_37_35]|nr:hypothetical protein [Ignavibacteria bacterium]OIO20879.1 MAG: hypothetical protein AUJ54_05170 [Ignavibacteria bacterium CG1_02_37_35]PIX94400.1 MAG: hypothetical protein COZ25_05820 [Ignavibacteria bacterium CG_4_10_14_3_um_filter_37_18]
MKELSEYLNQPLRLKQVSFFKRYYELKTTEEVIGTMQIRGFFGNSAEVTFGDKKWEIYKPSIWKSNWHIRESGYENSFAHFERKLFRKANFVFLPVGEKVQIVFFPFKAKIEIQTEDKNCLIRMATKFAWTDSAEITITAKSPLVNKYPWLIMLAKLVAIERKQSRAVTVPTMFGGF